MFWGWVGNLYLTLWAYIFLLSLKRLAFLEAWVYGLGLGFRV